MGDDLLSVIQDLEQFEWLYGRLADERSRRILVDVLRARMVGPADGGPAGGGPAARDSARVGAPLGQYDYPHQHAVIGARPGDVVVDGGGRWGDAAIHVADRVGPSGRVVSVIPSADDRAVLEESLAAHPRLSARVTVIERALSDHSGEYISYRPRGRATVPVRLDPWGSPIADAATITIDELVDRQRLHRVDVITLDLDGLEMRALIGGRETIRTHRPRLVISLAHGRDALISIPARLDALAADYELFLDSVAVNGAGPMLFARPRPEAARP
jgi:FkbM family methyltransferase